MVRCTEIHFDKPEFVGEADTKKNVSGIVINAFSEPFVLDRGLFDLVERMKSRLT